MLQTHKLQSSKSRDGISHREFKNCITRHVYDISKLKNKQGIQLDETATNGCYKKTYNKLKREQK